MQTPPQIPPLTAQQVSARAAASASLNVKPQGAEATQHAPRPTSGSRQLASLAGPLGRAVGHLDAALIGCLSRPGAVAHMALVRLEAAILYDARLSLAAYIRRDGPEGQTRVDAVVAETLMEACEDAVALAQDLQSEGLMRLERLWSGCRALTIQLTSLGGDGKPFRAALIASRTRLTGAPGSLAAAETDVAATFEALAHDLHRVRESGSMSALDSLLFPA